MSTITCLGCGKDFPALRSFPIHLHKSAACLAAVLRSHPEDANAAERMIVQEPNDSNWEVVASVNDSTDSSKEFSSVGSDESITEAEDTTSWVDVFGTDEDDLLSDEGDYFHDYEHYYTDDDEDSLPNLVEHANYEFDDDDLEDEDASIKETTAFLNRQSAGPVVTGIDFTLYEQRELFLKKNIEGMPNSPNFLAHLDLLTMLDRKGVPLGLYDEIVSWVGRCSSQHQYKFDESPIKREKLLDELFTRFDMHGLKPKEKTILLPGTRATVKLVLHDVHQAVYSLLNDSNLMQDDNLLFEGETPYSPPPQDKTVIGDINTGDRFRACYQAMCTVPYRDVLCPLIAFANKTHTDVHGNLCLEPVSITLGIFNRATRIKPEAWRVIGYVKNQSVLPKASPVKKAQDYHFMMDEILRGVVNLQQTEGLFWKLQYKDQTHDVVFKLPVLFVIGDNEGHNKLCGRYLSWKAQRLCRYCDTVFENIGNPNTKFTHTKQSEVEKLVRLKDTERLKNMSQHLLCNHRKIPSWVVP